MDDTSTPPVGLHASLNIAMALSGFGSDIVGQRELSAHLSEKVLGSVEASCLGDERAEAYWRDLLPCVWNAARSLIADNESARRHVRDAEASYAKSRDALDRLAGVGTLGVSGWLARIGAVVAGFGVPQLLQEAFEQQDKLVPVIGRSATLARSIELAIIAELREPAFAEWLLISLAGAALAGVLVTRWMKRYRAQRMAALAETIQQAAQAAKHDVGERHSRTLVQAVKAIGRVQNRHYPGSVAREVELATGAVFSAEQVFAGEADAALRQFVGQHLDAAEV